MTDAAPASALLSELTTRSLEQNRERLLGP